MTSGEENIASIRALRKIAERRVIEPPSWPLPQHRRILVSWMADVVDDEGFEEDTLHLAVDYMDRFFDVIDVHVGLTLLQAVGVVCVGIASKFNEVHALTTNKMLYDCAGLYTVDKLLCLERIILTKLAFELCTPTAYAFLCRLRKDRPLSQDQVDRLFDVLLDPIEACRNKYTVACEIHESSI